MWGRRVCPGGVRVAPARGGGTDARETVGAGAAVRRTGRRDGEGAGTRADDLTGAEPDVRLVAGGEDLRSEPGEAGPGEAGPEEGAAKREGEATGRAADREEAGAEGEAERGKAGDAVEGETSLRGVYGGAGTASSRLPGEAPPTRMAAAASMSVPSRTPETISTRPSRPFPSERSAARSDSLISHMLERRRRSLE